MFLFFSYGEIMALSEKQSAFVRHYLIHKNATAAALHAGYSERTAGAQGSRLLDHPEIKLRIAEANQDACDQLGITKSWVLGVLKDIVEKSTKPVPVLDKRGRQVFVDDADGNQVAAYTIYDGKTAVKASELLGRHLKLFTEKVEVSNPEGETFKTTPVTAEEAARWYAEKMRRA